MSTGKAATFTAGLVQMRSGLSPQANLDAAVRLIEEAKRAGADYVLTPEMSNILEVKRERICTRPAVKVAALPVLIPTTSYRCPRAHRPGRAADQACRHGPARRDHHSRPHGSSR